MRRFQRHMVEGDAKEQALEQYQQERILSLQEYIEYSNEMNKTREVFGRGQEKGLSGSARGLREERGSPQATKEIATES